MAAGILFNAGMLGYFKYAVFTLDTFNALAGTGLPVPEVALPIGISFFTFTQIAWLVDMRSMPKRPEPWDYLLFVTFFPHLIAGPILHHAEMMPQFNRLATAGRKLFLSRLSTHMAVGVTIFVIGLFKKVVIADGCAGISNPIFEAASSGTTVGTVQAWCAALGFSMQIYFDFSGYSDMAVGLARMFGIRLPINFFSPYKATSIVEFWRRWHMTLSRWLRDYVYIPLGGSRKGPARRYVNLMATMLIGGLWHGAAWSFVLWGAIHGIALVLNHLWNRLVGRSLGFVGWLLTSAVVLHAWVLFKAGDFFPGDFATAAAIYGPMYDWTPGDIPDFAIIGKAMAISLLLPNTYEVMRRYRPVLEMRSTQARDIVVAGFLPAYAVIKPWRPTMAWALTTGALASTYLYVVSRSDTYVAFIYFRF